MKITARLKPAIDSTAARFVWPDLGQTLDTVEPIIKTGAKVTLHELFKAIAGRKSKSISITELCRWIREQERDLS